MEINPLTSGGHLSVQEAIVDCVVRNTRGLDQNDVSLMNSAFTPDAVQDMTAFTFLNATAGIIKGRNSITEMAASSVGKLDTAHMTSSFRTWVSADGKSAQLNCYALAQHWRPGRAGSPTRTDYFMMVNRYDAELVLDDSLWRMTKLTITPQWTMGDPQVFDPATW